MTLEFLGISGVLVGENAVYLLRPLSSLQWHLGHVSIQNNTLLVTCCMSELGYGGLVVVLLSCISLGSRS